MDENAPLLPTSLQQSKEVSLSRKDEAPGDNIVPSVPNSTAAGYLAMVVAATCFGTASVLLRVAEKTYDVPSSKTFFINFFVSWLTLLPCLFTRPGLFKRVVVLTREQYFFTSLRAIFGTFSGFLFVNAVNLAPVGDVAAAYNVCPAVTLVLAAIFLRERIRMVDIFSLSLSSVGIYLITRVPESVPVAFSRMHLFGIIMAAGSGAAAASAYITIRHLKTQIHCITPPFFFFLFASLSGIFLGGVPSVTEFMAYGGGAIAVVIAGMLSGVAQVFLSMGLQHCPAGPAIIIRNLEVPFEYIMGLIFLNETPAMIRLFAAFLILSSTVILGIKKS